MLFRKLETNVLTLNILVLSCYGLRDMESPNILILVSNLMKQHEHMKVSRCYTNEPRPFTSKLCGVKKS